MEKIITALLAKKEQEGKSVAEMADDIGIHFSTLYRILNGQRTMGMDTFQKVLKAYPDVNPEIAAIFLPEKSSVVK